MITQKLDIIYDVDRLWAACCAIIDQCGWGELNQINLIHRPETTDPRERLFDGVGSLSALGLQEEAFTELNDICRGTYIEDVVQSLPCKLGRLRIMRLHIRRCMSVHQDTTMRIHLPLITNPQALMIFPDHAIISHMPADGHVYLTNTLLPHTAMNGGLEERCHLVGVVL
jgi:hypothetical protein